MIDFRYHLVSLISVFLALAVGIALGAGPLEETIGETLTGQVEVLRVEKDELRAALDATENDLAASNAFADASGERLLVGALPERRVAVVVLGEVPEERLTAIDDRLAQAGADVTTVVTLAPAWTDPAAQTFRDALASPLVDLLAQTPAEDAGTQSVLADALVEALSVADPADPDAPSADAAALLDLLATGDEPLLTVQGDAGAPADALVVLAADPVVPDEESPAAETATEGVSAQLAVLDAAARLTEGVVLADGPRTADSLTTAVIGGDLAGTVTTVQRVDQVVGQVVVPLALAADIAGETGHHGYGDDLTVLPPAVELAPVDRSVEGAGTGQDEATQGEQ